MPAARLDTVFITETPEGIALPLRPAGVMTRSYAFLIDALLRGVVLIAASTVLSAMSRFGTGLFLLLLFAVEWLYPVLFELLPGAATPGKRAMNLRVVMDSGLPVTPAASLVRNLLRTADFLPIGYALGLLLLLVRPDFKRLGDLAAGTLVVHTTSAHLDGLLAAAEPMPPARPLSTREQAAVVAWAGRAARLTPERLEELAGLASAILPGGTGRARAPQLSSVAQWLVGRR
ncbi:MAG: RDD family protein [Burkholderiales bacterium]